MSEQNKNTVSTPECKQELTNWQKIDQLEAEIERAKPKKKKRLGGMKFRKIFQNLDLKQIPN